MPYSISEAQVSDIKALEELERHVFIPSDGLLSKRAFRYHIQKKKNVLLVAREDTLPNKLLGYILVLIRKKSARIYSLAVNPDCRKQGVGRALIQASINKVVEQGITMIRLELRKGNTSALKLYESLGFVGSSVRPDYYEQGEDALVMTWNR